MSFLLYCIPVILHDFLWSDKLCEEPASHHPTIQFPTEKNSLAQPVLFYLPDPENPTHWFLGCVSALKIPANPTHLHQSYRVPWKIHACLMSMCYFLCTIPQPLTHQTTHHNNNKWEPGHATSLLQAPPWILQRRLVCKPQHCTATLFFFPLTIDSQWEATSRCQADSHKGSHKGQ